MANSKLPSDDIQALLKKVVSHFDKEDREVRERQIRTWKKLKFFWEGIYRTWWSETAHDIRVYEDNLDENTDQGYYDKPVNIFRAYLESIIAALSITVPPVKCYPYDADDTLDLLTARTGDKIGKKIYRNNDAPLLWLHSLFVFCTEGMVAAYSYPEDSEEYGTYERKVTDNIEEHHQITECPNCGYRLDDSIIDETNTPVIEEPIMDEQQLGPYGNEEIQNQEVCPSCGQLMSPVISQETYEIEKVIEIEQVARTRICIETYGGLYVKVPSYARKQKDCPYLRYSYESHFANVIDTYPDVESSKLKSSGGSKDPYEEHARLSPQYRGDYPDNLITVNNWWFRGSAFNVLDNDEADKLKELYPDGVKVVMTNDLMACVEIEKLDDRWTLTYNPLADSIHFDPIGLLLVSLQELTNDLLSLIIQTIEHGIGSTFADPSVLNFTAYRNTEAVPGGVYEAKPKAGKSLSDGFYELKTAHLSPETLPFVQHVQTLGQLVSGALPSLFGGAIEGSETASEYSMSRAQALQRLQNTWKMLTGWWVKIHGKAIPEYIKHFKEDENEVERTKDGNFINVFIRKSELEGRIGRIELEANENLPITWSQKKDIIMNLLQTGNPEILATLALPENLPLIREAIGLDEFNIPFEDIKNKQYEEIKLLLQSEPMFDPESGMEFPSVEVDPEIDNHEEEFGLIQRWAVSDEGRQTKADNEAGYRNVLLHAKMHKMLIMPKLAIEDGASSSGKKPKSNAPISGEENVNTI